MAYKRIKIRELQKNIPAVPVKEYESSTDWKPFSYYLNGGIDPTGEHTDLTHEKSFDPDVVLNDPTLGVDALCDPRTSFFDLVERGGVKRANKATEAVATGAKEDNK